MTAPIGGVSSAGPEPRQHAMNLPATFGTRQSSWASRLTFRPRGGRGRGGWTRSRALDVFGAPGCASGQLLLFCRTLWSPLTFHIPSGRLGKFRRPAALPSSRNDALVNIRPAASESFHLRTIAKMSFVCGGQGVWWALRAGEDAEKVSLVVSARAQAS